MFNPFTTHVLILVLLLISLTDSTQPNLGSPSYKNQDAGHSFGVQCSTTSTSHIAPHNNLTKLAMQMKLLLTDEKSSDCDKQEVPLSSLFSGSEAQPASAGVETWAKSASRFHFTHD